LYRAAQEALSNVRKHAGNADVEVALVWADDQVELTVADSGDGTGGLGGSGYGLAGMAERVSAVGGRVASGPLAGGGFRVRVTVPTAGRPPLDHQPPVRSTG
jgi:signal transduction histidine kinase